MTKKNKDTEYQNVILHIPLTLLKAIDTLCNEGERTGFICDILEKYANSVDGEKTKAQAEKARQEKLSHAKFATPVTSATLPGV